MKVAINFRQRSGPWGGGNRFLVSLVTALKERGDTVCYELNEDDIDLILLMDPRWRHPSLTFTPGAILRYLLFQNWSDKAVRVEIKETVEITSIIDTIKEYYTLTNINSDIVCCADLYITCNLIDKKKVEKELNSRNIMKRKCTTKQYNNKWCYYGLKLKSNI